MSELGLSADPGAGHPRHAPPAPHRPRAREDRRGVRRGASSDRALPGDPRRRARGRRRSSSTSCERSARSTATTRRTQIVDEAADISVEDLIVEEDMVVTISHEGYIKRNPVEPLPRAAARRPRQDRRDDARRGLRRAPLRRLDALVPPVLHHHGEGLLAQGPRDPAGRPRRARARRRQPAAAWSPRRSSRPSCRCASSRTAATSSSPPGAARQEDRAHAVRVAARRRGLIAIALEEGDEVVGVRLTDGTSEVILSTAEGQAIRFEEAEVRPMGRGDRRRPRHDARRGRSAGRRSTWSSPARRCSRSPRTATASAPGWTSTGARTAAARASSP